MYRRGFWVLCPVQPTGGASRSAGDGSPHWTGKRRPAGWARAPPPPRGSRRSPAGVCGRDGTPCNAWRGEGRGERVGEEWWRMWSDSPVREPAKGWPWPPLVAPHWNTAFWEMSRKWHARDFWIHDWYFSWKAAGVLTQHLQKYICLVLCKPNNNNIQ